jgi:hypothetical protein
VAQQAGRQMALSPADALAGAPGDTLNGPATRRPPREESGRRGLLDTPQARAAAGSAVLLLFFWSLVIPVRFRAGELLLSPDRIFLLIAFLPLLIRLLSGRAGRILTVDILFGLYLLWIAVALLAVHGTSRIAFLGITIVELGGGYLVGRTLVRSAMDYRAFFRYFAIGLICIMPFAMIELFTRRMLVSEILGVVFETFPYVDYGERLGLNRVQATFEHPILFGLFSSLGIANLFYLYRDRIATALSLSGVAVFTTFMSLSSAALISIFLQMGMIVWDKLTKGNWRLLILLAIAAYVFVDILSNRSPVSVFIDYLTLNSHTGFYRMHIWTHGKASVLQNPVFGLGLNDWARPAWMRSPTVDNFWLLTAMRYGLPAIVCLIAAIVFSLRGIFARRDLSFDDDQCRTAYTVGAAGLFFTLCTVHVWGSTSVLVMFYIGAGVWLADAGRAVEKAPPEGRQMGMRRERNTLRRSAAPVTQDRETEQTTANDPSRNPRDRTKSGRHAPMPGRTEVSGDAYGPSKPVRRR